MSIRPVSCLLFVAASACALWAADPPDTLTLSDGETLSGKLIKAVGGNVTFHSDAIGDVTVPWAKVKSLSTAARYAVIPKGVVLKHPEASNVPQGNLGMADSKIQINPGNGQAPVTADPAQTGYVVSSSEFDRARQSRNFFQDWKGALSGGISLIEATQKSETFTGAVNLIRSEPTQDWLTARNRTLFNFAASYGKIEQPNTLQIKTDLVHFDAERDEYFSPRGYALGQATFDHNFSQGLDLQQAYSGGAGWSLLRSDKQTLDVKATASYVRQQFSDAGSNHNLIASTFGEAYSRKLPRDILFTQQITYIPAWNEFHAYSANGSAALAMPVYKRLSLNVSLLDTFLNDPPPGFKKNSFQFTTGVTYSLP